MPSDRLMPREPALPGAGGRILVLVHGSCMNDRMWLRNGHDHGAALARDLGYTPLYLHYDSGRHVSTNGRDLAALLEELVEAWPVRVAETSLVAHSMGGLVARAAGRRGRGPSSTGAAPPPRGPPPRRPRCRPRRRTRARPAWRA